MVSIIVPCFNSETTIEKALLSVLHQTYTDCEIIIVDDGSTDNTRKLIDNFFQDKNLKYTYLYQENSGPSKARNYGIANAKGNYIAFLDSDDEWHPQKIAIQIEMMKKTKSIICGTVHKNILQRELEDNKKIQYLMEDIPFSIISWPGILFKTPFATPSVIIDKCLKDYLFDDTMKYAEDYNLWKKITYTHKAIKILLPLTYTFKHDYISHAGCLSGNLKMMQQGVNKSFFSILKYEKVTCFYKPIIIIALLFSQIKYIIRLSKYYLFLFTNKRG